MFVSLADIQNNRVKGTEERYLYKRVRWFKCLALATSVTNSSPTKSSFLYLCYGVCLGENDLSQMFLKTKIYDLRV